MDIIGRIYRRREVEIIDKLFIEVTLLRIQIWLLFSTKIEELLRSETIIAVCDVSVKNRVIKAY